MCIPDPSYEVIWVIGILDDASHLVTTRLRLEVVGLHIRAWRTHGEMIHQARWQTGREKTKKKQKILLELPIF